MIFIKNIRFFFFLISALLISCSKDTLSPREYYNWVNNEDNGLHVKKNIGDFECSLQYKPLEYIVVAEQKKDMMYSEILDKRIKELKGMQYYTFQIKNLKNADPLKANISSEAEYYQRIEYFTGIMQDDLSLIEGQDTITCELFHFERNYGIAPYVNFVVGFPDNSHSKEVADKEFIYNDRVMGFGPLHLIIKGSAIAGTPTLSIKG